MTLDEAIKHTEEVAEEKKKEACNLYDDQNYEESRDCIWCSEEHRQLAEWLKDYKRLLEQEPCEDAVSRQALLSMQYRIDDSATLSTRDVVNVDDIEKLPSVKPQEPKTGHWVEETINGVGRKVFCSKCGCPPPFEHISTGDVYSASGYGVINKTKFCPNCGIKMEVR